MCLYQLNHEAALQVPIAFTTVALALCKELCPLHIFSTISLQNSSWKKNPWNFPIIWRNSYNPYDDNQNGERHQRNKRNSHIPALFCVFLFGNCSLLPTPRRNVLKSHSQPTKMKWKRHIHISMCVNHQNPGSKQEMVVWECVGGKWFSSEPTCKNCFNSEVEVENWHESIMQQFLYSFSPLLLNNVFWEWSSFLNLQVTL